MHFTEMACHIVEKDKQGINLDIAADLLGEPQNSDRKEN